MTGLFRRGGVWWARMVVPERLRDRAGRREFVQSTGTHEYSVGKLVAAVLLAGWRRVLYELERGRVDSEKLLRLIEGSPILGQPGYLTIKRAVDETGLDRETFLRAVSSGRIGLYYQVGALADGHVIPAHLLAPIDPELGRSGGVVIPDADQMPDGAAEARFPGQTLRIPDGRDVAGVVLTESKDCITLVALDAPSPAGWLFAPNQAIDVLVDDLALLAKEVDALRIAMAARVAPERIEHARAERRAALETHVLREKVAMHATAKAAASISGKWANKRFSDALNRYCASPDGLPGSLGSEIELRQRKAGLMLFAEFMGDLRLSEIDGDVLRKFRDGPLKTIPGRANTLPKEIKHPTMKATIAALKADGREWPLLSADARRERMQWLARLFAWLHAKGYISEDPAARLRGETGMTKAQRDAAKQTEEDDDEEGREPFTPEQLMLIFGQLHYRVGHGMHVKKPARWYGFEYWLPLLGLFAGLRIKEASQLHLNDVREVDGVWCLDINRRSKDKSLKNDQSVRVIPLHPMLIELGFLRYCDRLRQAGYRRVFPELTWSKSNAKYAKESGRKMSSMLMNLGMARDGTLVYHCLRHNANNALARVSAAVVQGADENLKKFIRYVVMGHVVGDDVNAKHYTNTTAKEKAALVGGVEHELPTIHEFDIDFALGQIQLALGKKKGYRRGREDMGPLNDAVYAG